MVGIARSLIRILSRSRRDVGCKAPPLQEKVKMMAERREKSCGGYREESNPKLRFRRGDVGGKAPPLQEIVKMEVERWVKIVG